MINRSVFSSPRTVWRWSFYKLLGGFFENSSIEIPIKLLTFLFFFILHNISRFDPKGLLLGFLKPFLYKIFILILLSDRAKPLFKIPQNLSFFQTRRRFCTKSSRGSSTSRALLIWIRCPSPPSPPPSPLFLMSRPTPPLPPSRPSITRQEGLGPGKIIRVAIRRRAGAIAPREAIKVRREVIDLQVSVK